MTRLVVAGALLDEATGRLLLAQRTRPPEVAGRWELPGGKVESGETEVEALRRELVEELGVDVVVGDRLRGHTPLTDDLVLIARWARIVSGRATAHEHQALRWVDAAELAEMATAGELVPADTVWVDELLGALREHRTRLSGPR